MVRMMNPAFKHSRLCGWELVLYAVGLLNRDSRSGLVFIATHPVGAVTGGRSALSQFCLLALSPERTKILPSVLFHISHNPSSATRDDTHRLAFPAHPLSRPQA